ncbi:MAG TPA: endonuclease/exonuclease/phosphatase family protein [Arthrobacter sp.]|nr:endonuclease/exonuclease/phosphatase family protein [Arthrobacter sp.]
MVWTVLISVCMVLGIPAVILTFVRMLPFGLPTPFVQLVSFAPYLLLPLAPAMVAAFAVRWRVVGAFLLLALLAQLLWLVPAVTANSQYVGASTAGQSPAAAAKRLDVMALNALYGQAEAGPVVSAVRAEEVDVLVIAEFTAGLARRLDSAGLEEALPYSRQRPEQGPGGSAVYSRFPLQNVGEIPGTAFSMQKVSMVVPSAVSGKIPVQVVAVHAYPPFPGEVQRWRNDLRNLAALDNGGKLQIFAGDFNATIDHAEFRKLLGDNGAGLFDAAAAEGSRLNPTWPMRDFLPALLTLDHIVASAEFDLAAYETKPIPGTDHKAVIGHLVLSPSFL